MWSKSFVYTSPGSSARAADRRLVDVDHLVKAVDPLDGVVVAGLDAHPVQAVGERLVDDLVHQRDLPEPETLVTATNFPTGNSTSMSFRLCMRAPSTLNVPRSWSSPLGDCDLPRARGTAP